MKSLTGKRVLVTGAAQGIGRSLAKELAGLGCELVLTDIDTDKLEEEAALLRADGATVHTYAYDVSREQAVFDMAQAVLRDIGDVDVLINNAGIAYSAELADTPLRKWQRLVAVNFWGPLYHVYAFLPRMVERRSGHIVNVSSGQAFLRLPAWGAYAATKAALGVFSEVLHFELRKHGIRVTTVYPYMVDTGLYADIDGETLGTRLAMKLLPYYSMRPEQVARIIVKAIRQGRKVEKVSIINKLGYYAKMLPYTSDAVAITTDYFLNKRG